MICIKCKEDKLESEFKTRSESGKKRSECNSCRSIWMTEYNKKRILSQKEYSKTYYQENKEIIKLASKKNREAKPEEYREYKRKYQSERLKSDPEFALKARIRHRIKECIKYNSWKKTTKFNDYIGCSLKEFKTHIENQFVSGMSWENRSEWHIDHIMPLDFANNEDEMYELCHYENLRPSWATDNCSKNAEVTDEGYAALARIRECKKSTN